jgi:hypothetical protein
MNENQYEYYLREFLKNMPKREGNSEKKVNAFNISIKYFIENYKKYCKSLLQLSNADDIEKKKLLIKGMKILNKERSRHIPKTVSDKVLKKHFFECAWCGVPIFEKHHVEYFEHGGIHEEENLILLCPNDHTMVHSHEGYISEEELRVRKIEHKKADRLNGVFKTTTESTKVTFGKGYCENAKNIITANNEPRLKIYNENDNILIDAKFYNKENQLIFWMARNIFWSITDINISNPKIDFLELSDANDDFYLKIFREETGYLKVLMKTYINGTSVTIDEDYINMINGNFSGNLTLTASHVHTYISL